MIVLADSSIEGPQIVADILAKSEVLAHYEITIAGTFDRIEPMALELQRSGIGRKSGRELVRHIAGTLLIHRQETVLYGISGTHPFSESGRQER